mmetsp:Transcript_11041/g.32732  ORF Transcript_11041/g.32732 Transcript_11041/m.32732 type:complete len:220 (+) Transcript_11041:398-1057(+)
MRLALTRPASASRLAEHAVGPPGAALPARCAAQSCEKQGALLSWSIVQRGCESSTAPVLWCESLMGGNLLLHRHAQSLLYRRADLRAGGAHAHPGRSRAVAQSRALLTQEAVGELLPLDRRSSRRCRSLSRAGARGCRPCRRAHAALAPRERSCCSPSARRTPPQRPCPPLQMLRGRHPAWPVLSWRGALMTLRPRASTSPGSCVSLREGVEDVECRAL